MSLLRLYTLLSTAVCNAFVVMNLSDIFNLLCYSKQAQNFRSVRPISLGKMNVFKKKSNKKIQKFWIPTSHIFT